MGVRVVGVRGRVRSWRRVGVDARGFRCVGVRVGVRSSFGEWGHKFGPRGSFQVCVRGLRFGVGVEV